MFGIFLDIETTGLDPYKHRAIDIAFIIVDLLTGELKNKFTSLIKHPEDVWNNRDLNSMEINGYSWEQIASGKDPAEVGKEMMKIFTDEGIVRGKAVFICQNPAFDRSFFNQLVDVYTQESLNWPYHWLDLASMYWALTVQKSIEENRPLGQTLNLSKNEIAKKYQLPPEATPHHALNGVIHLIKCYSAVLKVDFPFLSN